jgi:hypothetical protein
MRIVRPALRGENRSAKADDYDGGGEHAVPDIDAREPGNHIETYSTSDQNKLRGKDPEERKDDEVVANG